MAHENPRQPESQELIAESHRRKYAQFMALPSLSQVHTLRDTAVVIAKNQQKLRPSRKSSRAQLLMPKGLDGYVVCDVADERAPEDRYWMHRFTGKVARTGPRAWTMKIVESFAMQEDISGFQDSVRIGYDFSWNDKEVLSAMKRIMCVEHPKTGPQTSETALTHDIHSRADVRFIAAFHGAPVFEAGSTVVIVPQSLDQTPSDEPYSVPMLQAIDSAQVLTGEDCEVLSFAMQSFGEASAYMQANGQNVRPYIPHDRLYNYPNH
jgi:hypothetical protein